MRKECKMLLKENNEREKVITKENNEVYTNMIIYLRGSEIDQYNQEQVRADLIEMIIAGQERGDDIKKVMGGKYKKICDEIIEAFPKKTAKQKLMDVIDISLTLIWILGGISVAQSLIGGLLIGDNSYSYGLTVGIILNMIFITIVVNFLVRYLCKNSFRNQEKNKIISFIKGWILMMVIIGGCMAILYFLDYVVIEVSIIYAIIFIAIVFGSERIINSKI